MRKGTLVISIVVLAALGLIAYFAKPAPPKYDCMHINIQASEITFCSPEVHCTTTETENAKFTVCKFEETK